MENNRYFMANVVVYSSNYCPYCIRAKQLLNSKNIAFEEINVDGEPEIRQQMTEKSGRRTVPQIFINDAAIGGCDDLYALEATGQLDKLLTEGF